MGAVSISLCYLAFVMSIIGVRSKTDCGQNKFQSSEMGIVPFCRSKLIECSPKELKTTFPSYYNNSGIGISAPSAMQVTTFCRPDENNITQSGIIVTWKLPQHSGALSVQGFDIHIEGNPAAYQCMVIGLKDKVEKDKMKSAVFNATIYPIIRNTQLVVFLRSLPKADSNHNVSRRVNTEQCGDIHASGYWVPTNTSLNYNYTTRELRFWFEPPPARYKFDKFKIALVEKESYNSTRVTVSQTWYTFHNLMPGNYSIFMQSQDDFRNDRKKCLCKNGKGTCTTCAQLESKNYEITEIEDEYPEYYEEQSAVSTKDENDNIWILVCVSIGAVVTVTIAIVCVVKRCDMDPRLIFLKKPISDHEHAGSFTSSLLVIFVEMDENPEKSTFHIFDQFVQTSFGTDCKTESLLYNEKLMCHLSTRVQKFYEASTPSYGLTATSNEKKLASQAHKITKGHTPCVVICIVDSNHSRVQLIDEIDSFLTQNVSESTVVKLCQISFNKTLQNTKFSTRGAPTHFNLMTESSLFISFINERPSVEPVVDLSNEKGERNSSQYFPLKTNEQSESLLNGHCDYARKPQPMVARPNDVTMVSNGYWLEVPELKRERYISSDSGRGGSEGSYRSGSFEDTNNIFNEHDINIHYAEAQFLLPQNSQACTCNHENCKYAPHAPQIRNTRESVNHSDARDPNKCPSCIDFYAPSELSFSEMGDYSTRDTIEAIAHKQRVGHNGQVQCDCNEVFINDREKRKSLESINSLMEKLQSINERSSYLIENEAKPGEVYSVCEGFL